MAKKKTDKRATGAAAEDADERQAGGATKTRVNKSGKKKASAKRATSSKGAGSKGAGSKGAASSEAEGRAKKPSAKRKPAARASQESSARAGDAEATDEAPKLSAAAKKARRVLAGEGAKSIAELGDELASGKKSVAAGAARVLDEIVEEKPEAVVPIIDRYAAVIGGAARRPAQSAAKALPLMARVAPARVARHLPKLKAAFNGATKPGRDGLVRTFAGLCTASVAYQKRLEDVLNQALAEADAKTLIAWSEVVLPALKGEPHARARATVEGRLGRIPKVHAQRIADFLGIKLRLRYR